MPATPTSHLSLRTYPMLHAKKFPERHQPCDMEFEFWDSSERRQFEIDDHFTIEQLWRTITGQLPFGYPLR